jgi:hypothetical protein
MGDSIERLSFELTTAALAEQERASSAFRTGAGTILAAASVAGSFLGARGAQRPLDIWATIAVVAFVLCAGSAIWVLLPRELVLSFRGMKLIATSEALDLEEVGDGYRVVCDWIEPYLELNRSTLARMSGWLTRACLLLAIEVTMWTISLTV